MTFRLFPSGFDRTQRRVYGAVLAFYLAATAGLAWPVYAVFGGIRPRVLGLPFSLVWVVLWVIASFVVLLALYLWEGRRERRGRAEGRGRSSPGRGPEGDEDREPGARSAGGASPSGPAGPTARGS